MKYTLLATPQNESIVDENALNKDDNLELFKATPELSTKLDGKAPSALVVSGATNLRYLQSVLTGRMYIAKARM